MHDCNDPRVVGQKAAQMSYTEYALNRVFFKIDIEHVDCLYILPSRTPDASDFSSARFDTALELSEHLKNLFSDTKNVGHKRAGSINLYIRGAKSKSGLKSIPAGCIVFDEYDEMPEENTPLAEERASGYEDKQFIYISTPTVPDFGINKLFKQSTQQHFMFVCPCCNRWTELLFPECLVVTADDYLDPSVQNSHLICKECGGVLPHQDKKDWLSQGTWEPTYKSEAYTGFYINQLYSKTIAPPEIATAMLKADTDPAVQQELFNSKAGLPHVVDGARITDTHLDNVMGAHENGSPSPSNAIVTLGADVGTWIHYEVDGWFLQSDYTTYDINAAAICRVLEVGKVADFVELDRVMMRFGVMFSVVDANPERRAAEEFKTRFNGITRLCFYGNDVKGKTIVDKEEQGVITVDRTSWLDMSLGRFKSSRKMIVTPHNLPTEYKDHLKSLVRVYKKDQDGNPVGRYLNTGPDHYGHARNYSELALTMSTTLAQPQPIGA